MVQSSKPGIAFHYLIRNFHFPERNRLKDFIRVLFKKESKTLGDLNDAPAYIQTIPRSGYRFVASVTAENVDDDVRSRRDSSRPLEAYELVGRGRGQFALGVVL